MPESTTTLVSPVSGSEVMMFNSCERRHYYAFILNLEPKLLSLPLIRGIVGHDALEVYYTNGRDLQAALDALQENITEFIKTHPFEFEHQGALMDLIPLLQKYHHHYKHEPFEVIEIEKKYSVDMGSGVVIAGRLDTLIEFTAGEYCGDYAIMDHKFVYNFKSQAELDMDPQGPRYVNILKKKGYVVSKFILNQVRHRKMKATEPEKYFRRSVLKISPTEATIVWDEHKRTALKIQNLANPDQAVRSMNPYICKGCEVQKLCKAELAGRNISNMIETDFKSRTYGYDKVDINAIE